MYISLSKCSCLERLKIVSIFIILTHFEILKYFMFLLFKLNSNTRLFFFKFSIENIFKNVSVKMDV